VFLSLCPPRCRRPVSRAARPVAEGAPHLDWTFDLEGIEQMYKSYEEEDLTPLLEARPAGMNLNFVRAERSTFRWEGGGQAGIEKHGHRVHLLENAGHWLHTVSGPRMHSDRQGLVLRLISSWFDC
jgi:hypothetical protein